ncbi:orotate phosphoribosyltransferase [Ferviditalea candida]|uniref:Orotate phosphoribosyltransferase n=1 Tax=Ferviditalea candida TaxID=3108399 RepID=A0ABU5ZDM0_9BACL|nr:orotate phosphoribosyltransferase [Paenibacillaceae bacterium T2]
MNLKEQIAIDIAEALLKIGAVVLRPNEPFTWASGMKSPIYCDNRLTISYPEIREMIADGFVTLIKQYHPDAELIAGAATGGIPHAAWVAQKLKLPMVYVRDKAKGHGKENRIEGLLKPGQKTVVIEDLVSTGGSSLKVAEAVKEAGGEVLGVLAIFTYELESAAEAFANQNIPLHTLTNYSMLLPTALQMGKIASKDTALLTSWKADPQNYAHRFE